MANEGRKLTAEPEDVTVHLISVALKQLSCHFHHLLQVLHLNRRNPTNNENTIICIIICSYMHCMLLHVCVCVLPGY